MEFLLGIDAFRHHYQRYLPSIIVDWLGTERHITVWAYHKLSVWQKILSWRYILRGEHDLLAMAKDFEEV